MSTFHHLKCLPEYFDAVKRGVKKFEVRVEDDKKFHVGDKIRLYRWDDVKKNRDKVFESIVDDEEIDVVVTFVLRGFEGLAKDYVVLSIKEVS